MSERSASLARFERSESETFLPCFQLFLVDYQGLLVSAQFSQGWQCVDTTVGSTAKQGAL